MSSWKFNGDEKVAWSCLELAMELGERVWAARPEITSPKVPEDEWKQAQELLVSAFFMQALRGARAIRLLAEAGLGTEGLLIARTLWESSIHFQFAQKDPQKRALRWIEYAHVLDFKSLKNATDHPHLQVYAPLRSSPSWPQETVKRYEEYRKKYAPPPTPPKRGQAGQKKKRAEYLPEKNECWAGPGMNVRRLAQEVGDEDTYIWLYSSLSQHTHGSVGSLSWFFDSKYDEHGRLPLLLDSDNALLAVAQAALRLYSLIEGFCMVFGMGEFEPEIRALGAKIQTMPLEPGTGTETGTG